ncbi:MAG: hypothetical protein AUK63_305 [bacterium P3]|nr:MAG: hypothetical protein AUK63_305 [bacterium P3]KWW42734.1 MAG: hypothetical protein F083_138 [bacterium F083]
MILRRFILPLLCAAVLSVSAQEFRCMVQVNYQKLMTTTQQFSTGDTRVYESLKQALDDFVNSRKWTALDFEQQEKIDCSISLILTEQSSPTDFKGQLQLQLRRPVFNSSYTSGLFNYLESADFAFTYNESQSLEWDAGSFYGNLSSTVAYYLYIMLGIYFDSFAPDGGAGFYDMASVIAQTAQTAGFKGWRGTDGQKARYWFSENHTNSAYASLHTVYYLYHRQGLDLMTRDQQQARAGILQAADLLLQLHRAHPGVLSGQQFVSTKIDELVSIFKPAPPEEQARLYRIVKEISPVNIGKFKDFNTR